MKAWPMTHAAYVDPDYAELRCRYTLSESISTLVPGKVTCLGAYLYDRPKIAPFYIYGT